MPGGSLRRLSQTLGKNTVSAMAQEVGLPWPPPPALHVRDIFERGGTALVLSGGGATGSFQVGAVRYLYDHGVRPEIICATSVGAVNGLKLAEGEGDGSDPNRGLQGLERIWLGLDTEADMYVMDSWVQTAPKWIRDVLKGNFGLFSIPELLPTVLTQLVPLIAIDVGVRAGEFSGFISTAMSATGIYNLQPIKDLATKNFDPGLLGSGGVRLRMATVGLQSGALKYVTEKGWLVDDPKSNGGDPYTLQVDPIQGMIASSSIPVWFEVQNMGGEWFVDGGVRQIAPIQAAIEMGATQVYAIVSPIPLGCELGLKGLFDIGLRAATDITIDEITRENIDPYGGWGVPVHLMRPTYPGRRPELPRWRQRRHCDVRAEWRQRVRVSLLLRYEFW